MTQSSYTPALGWGKMVAMADKRGPYRTFLRERIAPALRRFGLRGSGNVFVLPHERCWALVGFQASDHWARAGIVKFTINLTVANKAAWDVMRTQKLWYPPRPPANSSNGMSPAEVLRIGSLIPVRATTLDRWWTINDEHTSDEVADEVIAAVRTTAFPGSSPECSFIRGH
jgi:hypothetical protein